jgi:hypothetical protein
METTWSHLHHAVHEEEDVVAVEISLALMGWVGVREKEKGKEDVGFGGLKTR